MSEDLMFLWYEGFPDGGRVKMFLTNRGKVKAEFTHHPMVKPSGGQWKKDVELGVEMVAALFQAVQSDQVKRTKMPKVKLLPGQDATLRHIRVSFGKTPPFLDATFVDAPAALAETIAELDKIYTLVRPSLPSFY